MCVCVCVCACACASKEFHIKFIILYNMCLFLYDNVFLSRSLKCYSCSNKSTDSDDLHLIELTLHKDPPSFPLSNPIDIYFFMKKINISPREKYQKIIFKHDVSSFSIL